MNKIIVVVLVLLLIFIIFNFSSCGDKKENFSETSSSNSNPVDDIDCMTMCELKYGFGPEYDACIENCGS